MLRRAQQPIHDQITRSPHLAPEKDPSPLPKKSYQRARVQRGLDEVLTTATEALPTSPAPAAELRILGQL